jgi:hypothetical protein
MLNQLANYQYQVDEAMVLHFMGYSDTAIVGEPILEQVRSLLPLVHEYNDHWGTSIELPIERVAEHQVILHTPNFQDANDIIMLQSSQLPKILQRCDAVAVLLVTAGAAVSDAAKHSNDPLESFVLDAMGSAMTVELMKALTHQVFLKARLRGYGTTLRLGPGYTGWHIDDQATLLNCFDHKKIPVQYARGSMMRPEKTLLGLTGLKPQGKEAPEIEPCRICDLPNCRMRRFEFRGISD